jgi:hypothetical protein
MNWLWRWLPSIALAVVVLIMAITRIRRRRWGMPSWVKPGVEIEWLGEGERTRYRIKSLHPDNVFMAKNGDTLMCIHCTKENMRFWGKT